MSLGAGETTLLKLTSAYGQDLSMAGARLSQPIDRVQDRYGRTLMRHDGRDCWPARRAKVISTEDTRAANIRRAAHPPASAYQMVSMLEGLSHAERAGVLPIADQCWQAKPAQQMIIKCDVYRFFPTCGGGIRCWRYSPPRVNPKQVYRCGV